MKRPTSKRRSLQTKTSHRMSKRLRSLFLEHLESRVLLAIDLSGVPSWVEQGPGTILNGNNVEGIPGRPQAGAVTAMAPDPTNANRLFVASTNGGVWRTTNATAANPSWTPLTDQFGTLSTSAIAFSPLDATRNTLYVGTGTTSSGFGDGGPQIGVLKTTDGGNTWSVIGQSLAGNQINQIIPTALGTPATQVVLAATNSGIYRSVDGGLTFGAVPIRAGNVVDMDADPSNPNRFYASITGAANGFFLSTDGGLSFNPTNTNIPVGIIGAADFVEMAVHTSPGNNAVYAVTFDNQGAGVFVLNSFRSTNQGASWTAMDQPPGLGIPRHTSIAADPINPNVVFISSVVGTDTAACGRPSGRANRGDASQAAGTQWLQVTCNNANGTSPHPDSRDLEFDANGNLLESSDGGVYRLTNPNVNARVWTSVNGNLRTTEFYSIAYDSLNNAIFGGTQDNGSPQQTNPGAFPGAPPASFTMTDRTGADGGIAQVDNITNAGVASIHYGSEQSLGCFTRQGFDAANNPIQNVGICSNATAVAQVVSGTGGQTLAQVEANVVGGSTIQFIQAYALNAVDPQRMIIGTNFLYESTDQGQTLTSLGGVSNAGLPAGQFRPTGAVGAVNPSTSYPSVSPIAYGGISGGVSNLQVLWVGAGGNLFLRTSGTGLPTQVATYTGVGVVDIVMDPADWHTAYIVDRNGSVFKAVTDNTGTNTIFTNLTGNLGVFTNDIRTVQFVRNGASPPVLLVGGQGGVYRASNPNNAPVWTDVGINLPNAIAQDLIYNATDDLLAVGTYGRGAWTVATASIVLQQQQVLTVCGDENAVNQDDTFLLVREAANPLMVDVFLNGVLEISVPLAALDHINVFGVGGNDNLIVDSTNGLINVSNGVRYNGDGACPGIPNGAGFNRGVDRLTLQQTGGPTRVSEQVAVGATVGTGVSTIADAGIGNSQTVFFEELEPLVSNVPAASFIINGGVVGTLLNSDNAINYSSSDLFGIAWGKVSIDAFETIHFTNKTLLTIDAENGSDLVNLNNPNTPTGLTGIRIDGGDPTASDTLVVTGSTGSDSVTVDQLTQDGARIRGLGPVITAATVEHLIYSGQGGADNFAVVGTAGSDTIVHTPGIGPDEGTFRVNTTLAISYLNLGLAGSITVDGAGNGAQGDTLVAQGTGGSDLVSVDRDSATLGRIFVNSHLPLLTGSIPPGSNTIENYRIDSLEGDDAITINNPLATGVGSVAVDAGGPGGSDSLTINGAGGTVDAFRISPAATSGNGGVFVNLVSNPYTGIEHLFVSGNGGDADTLSIRDDGRDNTWDVSPGTVADLVQIAGRESMDYNDFSTVTLTNSFGTDLFRVRPTHLVGYSASFTVNGNVEAPIDDILEIIGTPANDIVTSTANVVTMNGKAITSGVNLIQLSVLTLAGEDSVTLSLGLPGTRKFVDAGEGNDYVNMTATIDATILGGSGDDYLIGTPLADLIDGGAGNDTLLGGGGLDTIYGGNGNDLIVGGTGNDRVFGGDGSDTFVWNPGDNNDIVEGDTGNDVLQFVGGIVADTFTLTANGDRLRLDRTPGGVIMDVGNVEQVDTNTAVTLGTNGAAVTTLSGANEVPVNASVATGSMSLVYNSTTGKFDVNLLVQGIALANVVGAHIHVGPVGVNGGIIFDLLASSAFFQDGGGIHYSATGLTFPVANINDLLTGNTYINIHSVANPGGEIRAQLNFVSGNATTGLTGADTFTVNDLYPTDVKVVNLGLGNIGVGANANDASAVDRVTINGRTTSDSVTIATSAGLDGIAGNFDDYVNVAGLRYDVNVDAAEPVDLLTFDGKEGDDVIVSSDGLNTQFPVNALTVGGAPVSGIAIVGGDGDDFISGYGSLYGNGGKDTLVGGTFGQLINGGADDDQILGGGGDDTLRGGLGEDTFVSGPGADNINGNDVDAAGIVLVSPEFDRILIQATSGNDIIDVNQTAAATLSYTVNGTSETDTLLLTPAGVRTVEEARVEAGAGADLIKTRLADGLGVDAVLNSLRMTVIGGDDTTQDRLIVVEDGVDDLMIYRKSQDDSAGTVTIGPSNAEPLLTVFGGIERVQFVDETGAAVNPNAATGPQLVVFKHDPFEFNDDRFVATHIGANETVNVDPTIDPGALVNPFGDGQDVPGDRDFYRIVADVTGTLDFQVYFRQIGLLASGRPGLPNNGNLDVNVRDAAGNIIAGFGANDATNDERVRIPAVAGQTYFLEVFGNGTAINGYSLTIINKLPPVPHDLELLDNPVGDPPPANSDTGRSQFDNITRDNTPTLVFRLDDAIFLNDLPGNNAAGAPPDEVIRIPFQAAAGTAGYRIAIFDEGNSPLPGNQTGTAPQTPIGFATLVGDTNNNGVQDLGETVQFGVYQFTTPVLTDGTHFLSARVQMVDPATPQQTGFGGRSVALEIVVDTVIPPAFFGQISLADSTQGLNAASDTGVVGNPATFVDRVTSNTRPGFYGRAEADTIVRLYVESNGVAGLQSTGATPDLFLGLTTATPVDGTNQFPGGQWSFTTPLDLNNPALGFTKDGVRVIYSTGEDVAGNTTNDATADVLNLFLDTSGPQINGLQITGSPTYNLFGIKPGNALQGPTPKINSLTINVRDLPNRSNLDPNFLYSALDPLVAVTPGNFILKGDHNGIIAIKSITFTGNPAINGNPATGSLALSFFAPLPDDRFTLTVKDTLVDPVGNKLDGESNATEPVTTPTFPTGDGQPGADFVARFTVDSRPEVGVVSEGIVYVDINGNFVWDPEGKDRDATNRDLVFQFGQLVDAHFAGNFAPAGAATASGFDKLGAYGQFAGTYSFVLDTDDDGVADFSSLMPIAYQVNGIPVAGNFSAAHPGDEIGLFDGSFWYLDTNGNNQIDLGERVASNFNGLPIVGDFNGDGQDDLAAFNNATNTFSFDTNRDGIADFTWRVADDVGRFVGLSGFTDRPVAGDLNLDGIDDIGLWVKDRQGTLPRNSGEYFFWVSDRANPNPAIVFDSYSPDPLGNDLFAEFGDDFGLPIFGNFDPPVERNTESNLLHNTPSPLDVDSDGFISPLDVLVVINVLNNYPKFPSNDPVRTFYTIGQMKADPDNDRTISPLDVLTIINYLNSRRGSGEGEGEGEGDSSLVAAAGVQHRATDDFFAQLGADLENDSFKKKRR